MSLSSSVYSKEYFKLNEVCGLTSVKPYVLRFWESEFEEISPIVSENGQKLYSTKDLELISWIKKLLFEQKYSITKAKAFIRGYDSGPIQETEVNNQEITESNQLTCNQENPDTCRPYDLFSSLVKTDEFNGPDPNIEKKSQEEYGPDNQIENHPSAQVLEEQIDEDQKIDNLDGSFNEQSVNIEKIIQAKGILNEIFLEAQKLTETVSI